MKLIVRCAILALGVTLSAEMVPGITYDNGGTLLVVVVLLSFFNAFLKPILLLFSLPFIVVSMGLGIWIINALLIYWVSSLVKGFYVHNFGSALLGALIISLTNMVASRLLSPRKIATAPRAGPRKAKDDDVIDI